MDYKDYLIKALEKEITSYKDKEKKNNVYCRILVLHGRPWNYYNGRT